MIVQNLASSNQANPKPNDEQCFHVWNECLKIISSKVHEQSFATWFKPIKTISIADNLLHLEVPSQFFYEWLESRYPKLIRKSIEEVMGQQFDVEYSIKKSSSNNNQSIQIHVEHETPQLQIKNPDFETKLNPRFSFKNFIEGDGNKFAKAAALAAAEAPGKTAFNPLVIFGGTGLGKTHLMHSIGNFALEQGTIKRVLYATSEQFTSDFIRSIKENKTSEFSDFYRSVDLLLIDDIQFFSNKGKTQEEFFHTFNALHMSGKQLVLTCDRPPTEIKELEDRLLSRFQWGLVVDIQPPDYETRIAILQQRAEENNVELHADIIEYLALNVTSSIRELEGALTRILAQASLTSTEITLEFVKSIVQKIGKARSRAISIEDIIKITASYFDLQENLLLSKTRKKEIVLARQISMYLAKIYTAHTVKSIGLHFGGRDHTTVLYSVKMIEDQLEFDDLMTNHIKNIRKKLEQIEHAKIL
jgi:chromosomal replication initiator protein